MSEDGWVDIGDGVKRVLGQVDELACARAEAQAGVRRFRRLVEDQIGPSFDARLSAELDRLLQAEELLR